MKSSNKKRLTPLKKENAIKISKAYREAEEIIKHIKEKLKKKQ